MVELNGHELINGIFVAPFNTLPNTQLNNWHLDRLPEYFWLALIVTSSKDRKKCLEDCYRILEYIVNNIDKDFGTPFFSKILSYDRDQQTKIYKFISDLGYKEVLYPLTIQIRFSEYPVFSSYFYNRLSIKERLEIIEKTLKKTFSHDSFWSTDIRFLSVWSCVLSKKIYFKKGMLVTDALTNYVNVNHEDEIMKSYRPVIRSTEGALWTIDFESCFLYKTFWRELNQMSDEKITNYTINDDNSTSIDYLNKIKPVIEYYDELLSNKYPQSDRELVMFGLLNYSYTRFKEMTEHNLFNEPSGRSCIRSMIEVYLVTIFMFSKEKEKPNIWKEYRIYGAGEYKLTAEIVDSLGFDSKNTHINKDIIMTFSSSEHDPLFTNMDVKYFSNVKMRDLAEKAGEKELYAMYQHDSSFDHGLWCAVVESSLLHSESASSEYKHTLGIDTPNRLLSVLSDAIAILRKHIKLIEKEHPLPKRIKYE